ncbi:hypothetical protein P775_12095 [Puniceibacterium antarcticum]|uniref:Uncharacterized protein n=1 Tax=Puniceibacterium antarcticum TaxID=1206336 RepID=A0A2G8REC9_9RHOB|nr:hypothetical protein P775_12095 [Puniceibacterium antarcticum]
MFLKCSSANAATRHMSEVRAVRGHRAQSLRIAAKKEFGKRFAARQSPQRDAERIRAARFPRTLVDTSFKEAQLVGIVAEQHVDVCWYWFSIILSESVLSSV